MEIDLLYWIQQNIRSEQLDGLFGMITTLGNAGVVWIAFTIVLLIPKKTRQIGLAMGVSLLLCLLIVNLTMKPLFMRVRPYEVAGFLDIYVNKPHDFSFPSGHTATAFAAAWVFMRMAKTKFRYVVMAFACVVAFTRLYFFLHYPSDVGMSILLGIVFAELGIWIVTHFMDQLNQKKIEKEVE